MRVRIAGLLLLVFVALGASCDSRGRGKGDTDDPDPGGTRPWIDERKEYGKELEDDVWRITGPGITLRYDRGGVLFVTSPGGRVEIHDLDGAACVSFSSSGTNADSTISSPALVVNGRTTELLGGRLMHADKTTRWLRLVDSDSTVIVLVAPAAK